MMTSKIPRPGALALATLLLAGMASADNFAAVSYDAKSDQLVVTMAYRGTNPNHQFSLKWGECVTDESGNPTGVTAEVLDDQWEDPAEADYQRTTQFSLSGFPCPRPGKLTLRTAPRFFYTVAIP